MARLILSAKPGSIRIFAGNPVHFPKYIGFEPGKAKNARTDGKTHGWEHICPIAEVQNIDVENICYEWCVRDIFERYCVNNRESCPVALGRRQ